MKSLRVLILIAVVAALGLAQPAVAQDEFHGISLVKLAQGTTEVGQPYNARYRIANNVDTALDTLEVVDLSDTVFASGGNVVSGNILTHVTWVFQNGAHWDVTNTKIVLPAGGIATSNPHSFYDVVAGDFFLPNHKLNDQATINWTDLCDGISDNCSSNPEIATASGSTTITAPLPCVSVQKKVDCDVAKVGKEVIYSFTVTNCGPNPLSLVSIVDTVLGNLNAAAAGCASLAVDANCTFTVPYTIQSDDPDPLNNRVDVNYVDQFGQHATANSSASVNIIHPDFTVVKTCTSVPIPPGGPATFSVVIHNTGDVPLKFTTDEAALSNKSEPFIIPAGDSNTLTITIPGDCGSVDDVNNQIEVTANLVSDIDCPIPDIVKQSDPAVCYCVPTIQVDKTADCDVAAPGKVITYTITIKNTGGASLTLISVLDTLLGDLTSDASSHGCGTLAGGAECSFTVQRTIQAGDPNVLDNTVTVVYADSFKQEATDNATASVKVIHPDYTVTKTCAIDPIPADANFATFNVAIHNTGDVALEFTTNEAAMSSLTEPFTVGAGMTQNLTIEKPFTGSDVNNVIIVTANLVDDINCPIPNIVKESEPAICHAPGLATRTPGFWKTHCVFTEHVFEECGGSFNLGFVTITDINDLLGFLYANKAKNTDGSDRSPLCQARIQGAFQAISALLNSCLDNGGTPPKTPAQIAAILGGTDINAIRKLIGQLDEFNNSGDEVPIIESDDVDVNLATPQACLARANLKAADCIVTITAPTTIRRR